MKQAMAALTVAAAGLVSFVWADGVCPAKNDKALGQVPASKMESLGIPLATRYPDSFRNGSGAYARNVWTMRAFDGRVYVGCGNSANGGPAVSCGPVPIVAYDPKKGAFVEEWQAPDEQIDVLKVFSDGALYMPGHDPTEDWKFGDVFPATPEAAEHCLKVGRVSALGKRLVYVGGIVHVDHQMAPVGAYVAEDGPGMFRARRIALPKGATPWFTLAEGGRVYLLYSVANASAKSVRNHLAVSSDGEDFHDVLCFDAPTFSRAFAYLDGYMYFGLDTEIGDHGRYTGNNALTVAFSNEELSSASGTILRCPFELNQ